MDWTWENHIKKRLGAGKVDWTELDWTGTGTALVAIPFLLSGGVAVVGGGNIVKPRGVSQVREGQSQFGEKLVVDK